MRNRFDGGTGRGSSCVLMLDGESCPSSMLELWCWDSQHFLCCSHFYPPSCPSTDTSLQCVCLVLDCGFDCIISLQKEFTVIVVETTVLLVYLLPIIIKIGSGADSDPVRRGGWWWSSKAAGLDLGLMEVPVASAESVVLLHPFPWNWGLNTQISICLLVCCPTDTVSEDKLVTQNSLSLSFCTYCSLQSQNGSLKYLWFAWRGKSGE